MEANKQLDTQIDKTALIAKVLSPLLFFTDYHLKYWLPLKENEDFANYLQQRNFKVEGFYDGVNFLTTTAMMTNYVVLIPPTKEIDKYLYKAFHLGIPFAMLVPLYSLADEKVQSVLRDNADYVQFLFIKSKFLFNNKLVPSLWLCYKILPQSIEFEY